MNTKWFFSSRLPVASKSRKYSRIPLLPLEISIKRLHNILGGREQRINNRLSYSPFLFSFSPVTLIKKKVRRKGKRKKDEKNARSVKKKKKEEEEIFTRFLMDRITKRSRLRHGDNRR